MDDDQFYAAARDVTGELAVRILRLVFGGKEPPDPPERIRTKPDYSGPTRILTQNQVIQELGTNRRDLTKQIAAKRFPRPDFVSGDADNSQKMWLPETIASWEESQNLE